MKKATVYTFVLTLAILFSYNAGAQRLTILHVNDTHSHIDAERVGDVGHGGSIERAAYVDSVRTADGKNNVLLLHAGDFSQGSSYFTVLGGDLEVKILNAMSYDATAIGNHEFDNGIDALTARVAKLKMPVVCANYDFSDFKLGKYVKPYIIVRRGGLKVGIIGVTTDVRDVVDAAIAKQLKFIDPVNVVNHYAEYLRSEKGCDMVICLSHLGFHEDKVLAEKTSGVDLIIGGHSHTSLKGIEWKKNAAGVKTPIVQEGRWGLKMGNIKVVEAK